jgi:O-methyltransferase involved in polyketide biosynthesis
MNKVAPTAWLVAYRRTLSDIPLGGDIFGLLEKPDISDDLLRPRSAPQFEARYKLVNKLLKKSNTKQVLELASGLSPRGLNEAKNFDVYVENDLPDITKQKKSIYRALLESDVIQSQPDNLYIVAGDVLKDPLFEQVTNYFNNRRPIAVINEGLMRYLNFEQKESLAHHIHALLKQHGGVWINPDISLKSIQLSEDASNKGHVAKISQLTGVDIASNRFENVDHARKFFENLGFIIETHSYLEVTNDLYSIKKLGITDDELKLLNGDAVVFVMRAI